MSTWFPSVSDPAYVFYLRVVAIVLIVYGLVLLALRLSPLGKRDAVHKTWIAYRAWLVMGPLIFVSVGLGRRPFIALLGLLALLFVREFSRATGLYEDRAFVLVVCLWVIALFWSALIGRYGFFVAMPVYGILSLFMLPSFRDEYEGMIQRVGLSVVALVYLGWMPAHLAFLANHRDWIAYALFLIVGTELNDAAAYLAGRLFGRHKLMPRISPNKTVEGAIGSLAVVAAFTWGVRGWLPGFTPALLVASVLILCFGGILGDLAISFVKRDVGVKDMGTAIPGHGGLLDRCDSLLVTAPLFFHMIRYFVRGGFAA
jgi:phosphatidate cytidylyltransferase